MFVPGPVGAAVGALAAGAYLAAGDKDAAKMAAIGAAATLVGAGLAVAAVKAARVVKTAQTLGRLATRAAPKAERALALASDVVHAAPIANRGIYVVRSTRSGLPYVGMANNISRRLAQHVAAGKFTAEAVRTAERYAVSGNRLALRVAEQKMMNQLGGLGRLENKINSIASKYWSRHGIR